MNKRRMLAIISGANIIVLIVNILASAYFISSSSYLRHSSEKYPLLSKRIFAEEPNDLIINFVDLRDSLNEYLKPYGDSTSLYFEYLPSGVSISVNDRKQVRLASLAKVPSVMAAYRMIEQGLATKDSKVTLKQEYSDRQFGSLWSRPAGSDTTIGELARLAITESDNTAHNALLDFIPGAEIDSIYNSLDIIYNSKDGYPIISAKNYSSILRSLFLSSYLSKENSQEILQTMTETIYTDKIPAQLPLGVKVAHKIGVFESRDQVSTYSDCGIVYPTKRPFMICMMFDGDDETAQKVIATTSKMIYDFIIQAP